jgi:hypothetical protein
MAASAGTKSLQTDWRAPSEAPMPYWAVSEVRWMAECLYRIWAGSLTW